MNPQSESDNQPAQMRVVQAIRKPFNVNAVQVTRENIEEVAKWCGGSIFPEVNGRDPYIKVRVHNPLTDRQTKAFVGDWVLEHTGKGFKVYTTKAFRSSFDVTEEAEGSRNVFEQAQSSN